MTRKLAAAAVVAVLLGCAPEAKEWVPLDGDHTIRAELTRTLGREPTIQEFFSAMSDTLAARNNIVFVPQYHDSTGWFCVGVPAETAELLTADSLVRGAK